jgi:hypothetical protein
MPCRLHPPPPACRDGTGSRVPAGVAGPDQTSDAFISTTPLSGGHGDRLMRHPLDRLHGNIGFLELNIQHAVWSLIRVRPEMIRATPVAEELQAKLERLLDENLVSAAACRELDALRYGIAMARRY